jgi:hypothetical protein
MFLLEIFASFNFALGHRRKVAHPYFLNVFSAQKLEWESTIRRNAFLIVMLLRKSDLSPAALLAREPAHPDEDVTPALVQLHD